MTQAAFLNRIREVLDRQPGRWEFRLIEFGCFDGGYLEAHVYLPNQSLVLHVIWRSGDGYEVECPSETEYGPTATYYTDLFNREDAGVVA